jgi:hypothetical protein
VPVAEVRLRRDGKPGPPRHPVNRRRAWVLAAIATTTAAGAGLALVGLSVVRNSTAGRYVDPPLRSDEPGYQAYVASTPTLAVVQRGPTGGLAEATLLSLRPGDEGGAVVLVAPSTQAPADSEVEDDGDDSDGGDSDSGDSDGDDDDGPGGLTLAAAYAGGGADAVRETMSDILDVAIDDVVEVSDARWTSLVGPVAPVTLTIERPVGMWPAGEVSLRAADVGPFLAARSPTEPELDRVSRQAAFWNAWLAEVESGGQDAVPGELDSGIGRFVRGVAQDPTASVLPVTPLERSGDAFAPDEERIAELVSQAVPYPLSPAPGRRVRVRLLNGTTDRDLTPAAARQLVEAGAEITIAGNADSFTVTETTFTYHSPDERAAARRLADSFGVGTVDEDDDGAPSSTGSTAAEDADEIDVTIVLGSDAQDLIGRLESSG